MSISLSLTLNPGWAPYHAMIIFRYLLTATMKSALTSLVSMSKILIGVFLLLIVELIATTASHHVIIVPFLFFSFRLSPCPRPCCGRPCHNFHVG